MQNGPADGPPADPAQASEGEQPSRAIQSKEHEVLGRAVRELRIRRNHSQETFGFAAGLHRNYVGAIERGEINPTFRILMRLARGLRMPLSELIGFWEQRREDPEPPRKRRRRRRS